MRSWPVVPLAALLLAGCGSQTAGTSPSQARAASVQSACPSDLAVTPREVAAAGTVPLAEDLTVTAAIECTMEDRPVAGDGVWSYVVQKRADAGPVLERLVAALRAKDQPASATQACRDVRGIVPWFALVDAHGTLLRPHVPTTGCGGQQPAVMEALHSLTWTTVDATKASQVSTQAQALRDAAAASAGCPTPFKDLIAIEEADNATTKGADAWPGIDARGATVCRNTASIDNDGMPILDFAAGHRATANQATLIAAALAATAPVQACHTQHTAVTVLTTSGGAWYLVEDDGCHRVLDGNRSAWGQATPALLDALR